MTEKTIWIPTRSLEEIEKFIKKAQKKAIERNFEIPEIEITNNKKLFAVPRSHKPVDGPELSLEAVYIEKTQVILRGEMPVFSDWRFLAKIDHLEKVDGVNVNMVIPMSSFANEQDQALINSIGAGLSVCDPNCDHCKTKRFRNTTYIVKNDKTNEMKQIGSTCVNEFVGDQSLEAAMSLFDLNHVFSKEYDYDAEYIPSGYGGRSSNFIIPIEIYVAIASKITTEQGFVSKANESFQNPSTASCIYALLNKPTLDVIKIIHDAERNIPNPQITAAKEIIEWMKNKQPLNTFLINSIQLAKLGGIDIYDRYQTGIVASWPNSYHKELEEKREKENSLNEYFSEEKKRGGLKLRVAKIQKEMETEFPYIRFSFKDDEGRSFQWKASYYSAPDIDLGKTYLLTGTIKEHFEYRDRKITGLSRCSDFIECEPDVAPPDFNAKAKKPKKSSSAPEPEPS